MIRHDNVALIHAIPYSARYYHPTYSFTLSWTSGGEG
jgi:hypothetical protein